MTQKGRRSVVFVRQVLLAEFQHAQDRLFCTGADVLGQFDPRLEVQQGVVQLLQGIHLHVAAVGACTMAGGAGDELAVAAPGRQAAEFNPGTGLTAQGLDL